MEAQIVTFLGLIEQRWGAYPRRIVQSEISKFGTINKYIRRPKGLPKSEVIEQITPYRGKLTDEFLDDINNIASQCGVDIKIV